MQYKKLSLIHISYYERYKGKNAIWIPIRDVVFKQELDILEYSKQYVDYIEKNKSKIFTLIYKNAPDILSKEEVVEIVDRSTAVSYTHLLREVDDSVVRLEEAGAC